jgi:DNA polymerase
MAKVMYLDIETYCDLDLKVTGVYKYAAHPSFEILLYGWCLDDAPVRVDTKPTEEFLSALNDPNIIKVAHNANFETVCLRIKNKDLKSWYCTMLMCSELGYPASLEMAAEVLGLGVQKEKAGKALINVFSKLNRKGRTRPQDEPEKFKAFMEYCRQDVEVEREIYKRLAPLSKPERELWFVDQRINERGVLIDLELAEKAIGLAESATERAKARLVELTGLDRPTDAALRKQYGVASLNSKELSNLRSSRPELAEVLDARSQLAKTSVTKYKAMSAVAGEDQRARGVTQFMGAGRTGRWSGRLIQLQNLPRVNMTDAQVDTARRTAKDEDTELFRLLYDGSELPTISQLIRSAFIPKPGYQFVVADFSAIEARVLAWLSGEQWRLDVFRGDGRIYETSAERMFNLEPGSVGKSSPYRQKGKISELALGYGGSVGALVAMGALDMGLTEQELPGLVQLWRSANKNVTAFWRELHYSLKAALTPGYTAYRSPLLAGSGIHIFRNPQQKNLLQVSLPNGRLLTYVNARIEGNEVAYTGVNQTTKQVEEQKLYGAKLTENIVQATARDCLAEVLMDAEGAGLSPVFHVHDEIVCEVHQSISNQSLEMLLDMMKTPAPWASGCPLKGDGFVCDYYSK